MRIAHKSLLFDDSSLCIHYPAMHHTACHSEFGHKVGRDRCRYAWLWFFGLVGAANEDNERQAAQI